MASFKKTNVEGVERLKSEIPKELQNLDQWVLWREETRGNSRTKIPKRLGKGRSLLNAKSNDPSHWDSFANVVSAYAAGKGDGIGFVFSESDPYIGIDLDNKKSEPMLDASHMDWIEKLKTYAERSPSGTGYHLVLRGDQIKGFNRSPYEGYSSGRYFTFTGDRVGKVKKIGTGGTALKKFLAEAKGESETWERPSDIEKFKEGSGRNDTLFRDACSWLAKGMDPEIVADLIRGVNSRMSEPLSKKELEATIANAIKKHEAGEEVNFTSWLVENLIWVESQSRYWDIDRGALIASKESLEILYTGSMPINDNGNPISPWAYLRKRTPTTVHNLGWRPTDEWMFEDDAGKRYLNTYRRSTLTPISGDSSPWLDHVKWLIPDDAVREHILDWMAFVVQTPERKINHSLFIGGPERIGKDMMLLPLIDAVGQDNYRAINAATLESEFNSYLDRAKLLIINEMHTDTRTARKVENTLKQILTAPPNTIEINQKYLTPYAIDNVVSVIFMSNHRDALTITGGNAARYLCWWCDVSPKSEAYYSKLANWLDGDGKAKVMDFLLSRDVSKFNPKASAPLTAFAEEIVDDSRGPTVNRILDAISAQLSPFHRDVFAPQDVRDALDLDGYDKLISATLRTAGYKATRGQRKVDGKNVSVRLYYDPNAVVKGKRLDEASNHELFSVYLAQRKNVKYIKEKG